MGAAIGIDLGTTSSRVAVLLDGKPVIIENSEGEGTTPSYVGFPGDGQRLVGEAARRYAVTKPENVVFAVKTALFRPCCPRTKTLHAIPDRQIRQGRRLD